MTGSCVGVGGVSVDVRLVLRVTGAETGWATLLSEGLRASIQVPSQDEGNQTRRGRRPGQGPVAAGEPHVEEDRSTRPAPTSALCCLVGGECSVS
jgi:hypothetical protein